MTWVPSGRGTSVADLLDQSEDLLYAMAQASPSGGRLLASWPAFAAACSRLTVAAVGPRATGHVVSARRQDTDPVLLAGLRLEEHLRNTSIATGGALPDPAMTRVTQLVGAAADLVECAHDRPGTWMRDTAQTDLFRRAGILRAAELALAGLDLTVRACGRVHQLRPSTTPGSTSRLTSRATPLLTTRRYVAAVLDAAREPSDAQVLGDVHIPAVEPVMLRSALDRLRAALADWRVASLATAHNPAVSSAELQRASVEARHIIALAAALTHAGREAGLLSHPVTALAMNRLQHAGAAWSSVTDQWTRFTTAVPPSRNHIEASLGLQSAIRAISRGDDGAWLPPSVLARRVDVPEALHVVRHSLGDLFDVARAHQAAVRRCVHLGQVFGLAQKLPLTEDRVAARLTGRHVAITSSEGAPLRTGYDGVVVRTLGARTQVTHLARRRVSLMVDQHRASRPISVSARPC